MIDYRTDRLDAARQRAATIGYDGAMYPWESDDMGQSPVVLALLGLGIQAGIVGIAFRLGQ